VLLLLLLQVRSHPHHRVPALDDKNSGGDGGARRVHTTHCVGDRRLVLSVVHISNPRVDYVFSFVSYHSW